MSQPRGINEVHAEIAALRTLLLAVAPAAFTMAGIPVAAVEKACASVVAELSSLKERSAEQDKLDEYREAHIYEVEKLFGIVALRMRARAAGDTDLVG